MESREIARARRNGRQPLSTVAATLRAGRRVEDADFDQVFDHPIRTMSDHHWTPVRVAMRAARLLTEANATRVLDIGAGAGKFCTIAALVTKSCSFVGAERNPYLVNAARDAARRLGATRATFVRANAMDVAFGKFDGFYLFNPFYELLDSTLARLDDEPEQSPLLHHIYVTGTIRRLARAQAGAAVVTYHGFGGVMPPEYELVHMEHAGTERLQLWVKTR